MVDLLEDKNNLLTENAKYKADEEFLQNLKFQNKAMINQLHEELSQIKVSCAFSLKRHFINWRTYLFVQRKNFFFCWN